MCGGSLVGGDPPALLLVLGKRDVWLTTLRSIFLASKQRRADAITLRYSVNGTEGIHVVDGGYLDTGDQIVEHLKTYYGTTVIDHVILTHPDRDHANGLRKS